MAPRSAARLRALDVYVLVLEYVHVCVTMVREYSVLEYVRKRTYCTRTCTRVRTKKRQTKNLLCPTAPPYSRSVIEYVRVPHVDRLAGLFSSDLFTGVHSKIIIKKRIKSRPQIFVFLSSEQSTCAPIGNSCSFVCSHTHTPLPRHRDVRNIWWDAKSVSTGMRSYARADGRVDTNLH
jgi:hypothetical protein